MLKLTSHWFHPVAPAVTYTRTDYVLLWLMLAAGAWLRFWNLGYGGLHGDEDIMGLAARGVLEHGTPVLPSDMLYARALAHTYIIAGSMYVFGDTEWAMRFPSALVGSFCGLLAFFAGKRFLEPKINLLFAATMIFLPIMVEISQTARMYVFLVAGLLAFAALLFRWEATGNLSWLLGAFVVWAVTLHFHTLAAFAALLFLYPGMAAQSWRKFFQGAVALGAGFVTYIAASTLQSQYYPEEEERMTQPAESAAGPLEFLFQGPVLWTAALALLTVALVITAGIMGVRQRRAMLPAVGLLSVGVLACAYLHYHVGGIALLFGVILWFRAAQVSVVRLIPAAAAFSLMAAVQLLYLYGTGEFVGRQIIGAITGEPSVWPAIRFSVYSPVAAALCVAVLAYAAVQLARGRRIPEHFLFFAVAVWAPLLLIGLYRWDPAPRYMLGILPFFMLCLLAGLAYVVREAQLAERLAARPATTVAASVVLLLALVNPVAVAVTAGNDYRTLPDHKGAAEFVMSLNLGPDAVLVAEDSINQTFYLGRVDYRLLSTERASNHSVYSDGVLYGQYTGTPVIGSGKELKALIESHDAGEIYIIGSGENFLNGTRGEMRGNGIEEFLQSDRLTRLYDGRDGKTAVWRALR